MPSVAKSKGNKQRQRQQQAVIVNVHTAAPKRAARRAPRRAPQAQGMASQSQGFPAPSAFNGPSMHPGQFYVHLQMPVMPRLVPEGIQFGALSAFESPFRVKQEPLTPSVKQEPPTPAVKPEPLTPAVVKHEPPQASPPSFRFPKMEQVSHYDPYAERDIPIAPTHYDPADPTKSPFKAPTGLLNLGLAHPAPPAQPASETLAHRLPVIDENAPTLPRAGPHLRSAGDEGLETGADSAPTFSGIGAQDRLMHFLTSAKGPEIVNYFRGQGATYYARAKKQAEGKGRGRPIDPAVVDAVIQAHRMHMGSGSTDPFNTVA